MKIKLNENNKGLRFEDLEYGDVFRYKINDFDNDIFIGMKINNVSINQNEILDLTYFESYEDVEHYTILEVIQCTLVEGYKDEC